MLNNEYKTHMHKPTTSMDARHIYMTYTFEQTSDMNAIQCIYNTLAQANKILDKSQMYTSYTYEQASDINAIQCTYNPYAKQNNYHLCAPYIYDIHIRANK